ncbi:thioredoxin domain-containing protein [Alicycliphilus sp. T452]|jgi:hypothetical protein
MSPAWRRREWMLGAGLACALPGAFAADRDLPAPSSLADELAGALAQREPLVVMASLAGCPFCRVVREHYLLPAWRGGMAVVQIDLRDPRPVRDWEGRATTQGALLKALGVSMAPTVMFFGRGGREVAQRLSGSYIPDFYGAYLDQRMEQARAAVRA